MCGILPSPNILGSERICPSYQHPLVVGHDQEAGPMMRKPQHPGGMRQDVGSHVTQDGQLKGITPQHPPTHRTSIKGMRHPGGDQCTFGFYWYGMSFAWEI